MRLLDYACGSHRRAAACLVALCLLAFLPGFTGIPPVDRDEARFAQATKQMLESGDYVDIHFQNEVRYKKPVGIYWLQAAAVKTASALGVRNAENRIWFYRLPSLLAAIGAVLLTYWTALAFVSRPAALLAAAMMASSLLLNVEARLAKTDATLLLTVLAAMGALARIYLAQRRAPGADLGWRDPAIFWTALAAGFLIKGPLILMVVGLTIVVVSALDRSLRWILATRLVPGILWFALLVAPWFIAILGKAGETFIADSVGTDMLSKIFHGQESHGAPPGTYFVLFWVTFWPGAVLAGLAAPAIWRARREDSIKFLLAWLVPSWIVFELVATKLPHYVLPLYPAIAILIGSVIDRGTLSQSRMKIGLVGWFIYPVAISLIALVGYIILGGGLGIMAWPFAAAAMIMGLFAWRLYDLDGAAHSMLRAGAAALLVNATVFGLLIPSLQVLFPSKLVQAELNDVGCDHPVVASVGFHEPSLVFLLGTKTRLTDAGGAVEFLKNGPCRFAVVDSRNERSFAQFAQAAGLLYSPMPRIDAINFSNGRAVSLAVFRVGVAP
jgi:4-amino-4-deoxy-L-arabinose transferase-like glycosyltransferase